MKAEFATSFRDLAVFQRAYALSLEIHKASLEFPKIEQYALAGQLRRSSKSVCANIAEGYAKQRQSKAEFRRFVLMALGSLEEVQLWLDYASDLGYVAQDQIGAWHTECKTIANMPHKLRQTLEG